MRLHAAVVVLLLAPTAFAADAPTSLADGAVAAHARADDALAASRARIIAERADLTRQLQAALADDASARDRLAAAQRDRDAAARDAERRRADRDRESAQARQLADRAVLAAKLGAEATRALADQPPRARVAAAIAGLEARVAALPARGAAHVADEQIVDRSGGIVTAPVLRLGQARAIALGNDDERRGALERSADGASWIVVGPRLPPIPRAASGAPTTVPLDPDGQGAHAVAVPSRSWRDWLRAGRFFIWPILTVFAIGVGLAVERAIALIARRGWTGRARALVDGLAAGDLDAVASRVGGSATPVDRIVATGLSALARPRPAREAAVESILIAEGAALHRGLPAILVLAGISPLLGLLGTVTGMIDLFGVIGRQGSGNAHALSGGISEALTTTQAGMLVAIPLLVLHALLARAAERREQALEQVASAVLAVEPAPDRAPRPEAA